MAALNGTTAEAVASIVLAGIHYRAVWARLVGNQHVRRPIKCSQPQRAATAGCLLSGWQRPRVRCPCVHPRCLVRQIARHRVSF
jgi:hypothetical protein